MPLLRDTYSVLRREIKRIREFPIYMTLMVILPVVALLFFAVFFSKGITTDIPVAVVDMDKTPTSRTLISMVDATPSASVNYSLQNMLQAERMIKEGKIQAIFYIPRDFEKDIMSNVKTGVEVYISGVNITANGLLSKDIMTTVKTYSSGIQLQLLMKKGLSEKQAMAQVMPVYFDKHVLFNPYINYGYYLLPSFMPMMIMVFAIVLTVFSIGTELKNRTAGEWFSSAKGHAGAALVGKLLPYTLSMFVMCLFMNTIMYKWLGVPLNGSYFLLTIGAFMFVLAYQAIGVLIITLLSNLRLSLSIGGGYSVLAFTFSGLTFPRMAMDPVLQALCYLFPFTLYTEVFIDQAMRGAPPIYSVKYIGLMALYIILSMLCLPRLKKIATNEKYWGKT